MLRIALLISVLISVMPSWADKRSAKLVNAHFEYVKLVHAVAENCVESAQALVKNPNDKQLIIEAMRCYSFLLEKREKLEKEVFVPLRRLNFPKGELSEKEKEFVAMVYLMDEHIEEISAKIEPVIKQHQGKARK